MRGYCVYECCVCLLNIQTQQKGSDGLLFILMMRLPDVETTEAM